MKEIAKTLIRTLCLIIMALALILGFEICWLILNW